MCQKRKVEREGEILGREMVGSGSIPCLALEGLEELHEVPKIVKKCHEIKALTCVANVQPVLTVMCRSLNPEQAPSNPRAWSSTAHVSLQEVACGKEWPGTCS